MQPYGCTTYIYEAVGHFGGRTVSGSKENTPQMMPYQFRSMAEMLCEIRRGRESRGIRL